MLTLKILGGIVALAVGVWLGLPGKYEQTLDEIEKNMEEGTRDTQRVQRHFTPMAWMQRKMGVREPRRTRRPFRMESPEDH